MGLVHALEQPHGVVGSARDEAKSKPIKDFSLVQFRVRRVQVAV